MHLSICSKISKYFYSKQTIKFCGVTFNISFMDIVSEKHEFDKFKNDKLLQPENISLIFITD